MAKSMDCVKYDRKSNPKNVYSFRTERVYTVCLRRCISEELM